MTSDILKLMWHHCNKFQTNPQFQDLSCHYCFVPTSCSYSFNNNDVECILELNNKLAMFVTGFNKIIHVWDLGPGAHCFGVTPSGGVQQGAVLTPLSIVEQHQSAGTSVTINNGHQLMRFAVEWSEGKSQLWNYKTTGIYSQYTVWRYYNLISFLQILLTGTPSCAIGNTSVYWTVF